MSAWRTSILLLVCAASLPAAGQDGVYRVPDQHLWDGWAVETKGEIHRYSLSAPRHLSAEARHENAFVRHAVSKDGGLTWNDLGPVLTPRPSGTWPDHVVWTGATVVREGAEGREFLMFFTGRSSETGEVQKIGLARSGDGHRFEMLPSPVLEPGGEALGYDLSRGDGTIMAWRDPHVFFNEETGRWEMLFAAKSRRNGQTRAVVGRAVALDAGLTRWSLLPPLDLPADYLQVEVPSLVRREGRTFLFVSTKSRNASHAREGGAAFRGYVAGSIDGPWEPIYGKTDLIFDHRVYALNVFRRATGEYAAVGFYPRHVADAHTGTGLVAIRWENGVPRFDLEPHVEPRSPFRRWDRTRGRPGQRAPGSGVTGVGAILEGAVGDRLGRRLRGTRRARVRR